MAENLFGKGNQDTWCRRRPVATAHPRRRYAGTLQRQSRLGLHHGLIGASDVYPLVLYLGSLRCVRWKSRLGNVIERGYEVWVS